MRVMAFFISRDGRPTPQVLSLFVPKVKGSPSKPKLP
jgi:hypothetical protein